MVKTHKAKISGTENKSSKKNNFTKILFNEKTLIVVLILIAIFASTFFRMYPANLDVTEDWARDSYYNNIKANLGQQVNTEYPNLPTTQKQTIIDERFAELMATQGDQIEPQIKQQAEYFKSQMQDEENNTYLLAIDPYVWYSQAKNYEKNGFAGDEILDGKESFSLRNGREFNNAELSAPAYIFTIIHKIGNFFVKNFNLQQAAFITPVVLIALAVIFAFFLGRKIAGNIAGFVAGLVVALNTALLGRTPAGFSDTDAYIIMFPLLITWLFFEGFTAKEQWKKSVLTLSSSLVLVLFGLFWGNGWHTGTILLGVTGIYFIYNLIHEWKLFGKTKSFVDVMKLKTMKTVRTGLCFLGGSFVFGGIINSLVRTTTFIESGWSNMTMMIIQPFKALLVKSVAATDIWPNVLTTVAELNSGSWGAIINSVGGKLFFGMAVIGVLATLLLRTEDNKIEIRYVALLGIWFFGLTLAGIMSMRFIALLAAPFAIAFGTFFGIIWNKIPLMLNDGQKNLRILTKVGIVLLIGILFIAPITAAHNVAKNEVPSMNDAWYNSLTGIKENCTDGIITSWWDFGHWFVNIAERRVTFDGGDQGKRIYWVGKSLMTENLSENKAILRMLNCGQNKGYERLLEYTGDNYKSSELINTIIYENKSDAESRLSEAGLNTEEVNSVLEKTHCSNEELLDQYVIVSEDMVGKAGVWAHFGGWDFDRAYIYNLAKNEPDEEIAVPKIVKQTGLSEEKASQLYFDASALETSREVDSWISPWPNYITPKAKSCVENEGEINCKVGQTIAQQQGSKGVLDSVNIPSDIMKTTILVNTYNDAGALVGSQTIIPAKVTIGTEEGYQTYSLENSTFPYEVTIADNKVIIADDKLSDSSFSKLFFFNGIGMEGYEKLSDVTSFTGDRIIVYKVNLAN